jgi:phage terminase small subunit
MGEKIRCETEAPQRLHARQQRFVEEYLIDRDLSAAYRRAGYKPKSLEAARTAAHRLLRNVTVWETIQAALKARSQRTKIDQDYVLHRLKDETERKGEGSSPSARVRALELLGKHLGLFVDRHEHRHGGNKNGDLTDDERMARLRVLADRIRERRLGVAYANGNGGVRPTDSEDSG